MCTPSDTLSTLRLDEVVFILTQLQLGFKELDL